MITDRKEHDDPKSRVRQQLSHLRTALPTQIVDPLPPGHLLQLFEEPFRCDRSRKNQPQSAVRWQESECLHKFAYASLWSAPTNIRRNFRTILVWRIRDTQQFTQNRIVVDQCRLVLAEFCCQ